MKESRSVIYILTIIVLFVLSACVSKKKYLDVEAAKFSALERVAQLNKEVNGLNGSIADLKEEFNRMKNELHLSNAQKDSYIDSVNLKMTELSSDLSEQHASMSDQLYLYQTEKRQLTSALSQKQELLDEMSERINARESELAALKQESSSLKFDLENLKSSAEAKAGEVKAAEAQVAKIQADSDKFKKEIATLKSQITAKDAEITKLNNNVNLLKKQLGM